MADQFDLASEYEELERLSCLNKLKSDNQPKAEATGCCLYCEEPLPEGRRWCNAECRDEWEKEQRRK